MYRMNTLKHISMGWRGKVGVATVAVLLLVSSVGVAGEKAQDYKNLVVGSSGDSGSTSVLATPPATPRFGGPVTNFTAAVGKSAHLSCRVLNGTKYKVAWFHVDRKMLLTIHYSVVTRIPRFSVTMDGDDVWTLHINSVTQEDKGQYLCQVNTEPMISQTGYLDVVVPPEIVDGRSSASSLKVQENGNITLSCFARGNPDPNISWVREDQKPITIDKRRKVNRHEGSTLVLERVTRTDMGAYLCIASNGVPPTVSKRTELFVEFSPIVLVPNQLMSAPLGTSVTIKCTTEASPKAVTYWLYKNNMIMPNDKYSLEEQQDQYRTRVLLTIHHLTMEDYGQYNCRSRNSFGENAGTVEIHELETPSDTHRSDNTRPHDLEDMSSNDIEKYNPHREETYHKYNEMDYNNMNHLEAPYGSSGSNGRHQQGSIGTSDTAPARDSRPRDIFSILRASSGVSTVSPGKCTTYITLFTTIALRLYGTSSPLLRR